MCLTNAGHFCGNLLFRINLRAGTPCHSWLVSLRWYFSSIFSSSFHSKTWHFPNRQVLIKHFVSATERGPLSLENSQPCFCDRRAKLCRMWQGRLHEDLQRKALYIYSSVEVKASAMLSKSPLLVWNEHGIPDVYATTTRKQTLLLPCTEASVYADLDLAVITQTDSQSKAHHTLWEKNKLKSPCLCISFQNQ